MTIETGQKAPSELRDANHAVGTLVRLGQLIPFGEVPTYHGRVSIGETTPWQVDPTYNNAGTAAYGTNSGGARTNAYRTSMLYTADRKIATMYAKKRIPDTVREAVQHETQLQLAAALERVRNYTPEEIQKSLDWFKQEGEHWTLEDFLQEGSALPEDEASRIAAIDRAVLEQEMQAKVKADVHEIGCLNPDALIVDVDFDSAKIDSKSRREYHEALAVLTPSVPETLLLPRDSGAEVARLQKLFDRRGSEAALRPRVVQEIIRRLSVDQEITEAVAAGYRAQAIARDSLSLATKIIRNAKEDITIHEDKDVHAAYLRSMLQRAGVVGFRFWSNNREAFITGLYDLENIQSIGSEAVDLTA